MEIRKSPKKITIKQMKQHTKMRNVGIITWFCTPNYGSQLQAYALNHVLSIQGNEVEFICFTKYPKLRRAIFHLPLRVQRILSKYYHSKEWAFCSPWIKLHYIHYSEKEVPSVAHNFSTVICGSDQIWAPNLYCPPYMLSFVPDEVNKVSYAPSIGLNEIPENLVEGYKKYVGRINHVSIREDKGQEILKNQCGIDSTVVLDPTLLLSSQDWDAIKEIVKIDKPYLFCYFLRENHTYRKSVEKLAADKGLKIYGVSYNITDSEWMENLSVSNIGAGEFLGLISGAAVVVTDSYHGTIFSMLYHKDFVTLERFDKNDPICQNSRIHQLNKYFGIENNVFTVKEDTELSVNPVDYSNFENKIAQLREKSIAFLKNSLV